MKRLGLCLALLAAATGLLTHPASAQLGSSASGGNPAAEAAAWEQVRTSGTATQLKTFLDQYPKGTYAREARQKYSAAANTMLSAEVQSIDVQFPPQARRVGRVVGPMRVVTLTIQVRADGSVGDVDIGKSSGFDLYDNEAMSAARDATYLPAVNHGMPVDSQLNYDVSFGLLCNRVTDITCDTGRYPTTCSATVCGTLFR